MLLQYLDALVGQLCIFMGAHLDIASMFFVGNLLTVDEMGKFIWVDGHICKRENPFSYELLDTTMGV